MLLQKRLYVNGYGTGEQGQTNGNLRQPVLQMRALDQPSA